MSHRPGDILLPFAFNPNLKVQAHKLNSKTAWINEVLEEGYSKWIAEPLKRHDVDGDVVWLNCG